MTLMEMRELEVLRIEIDRRRRLGIYGGELCD